MEHDKSCGSRGDFQAPIARRVAKGWLHNCEGRHTRPKKAPIRSHQGKKITTPLASEKHSCRGSAVRVGGNAFGVETHYSPPPLVQGVTFAVRTPTTNAYLSPFLRPHFVAFIRVRVLLHPARRKRRHDPVELIPLRLAAVVAATAASARCVAVTATAVA